MGVGLKIKSFLEENNIQQRSLSVKSHITTSKLNLALNEKRRMTFDEYEVICYCLNVNTDKFLEPKKPEGRS
jgi:DNA-binding Xre family transcriptional regulator